ncbi:MAG: DNA helicase UvrD [Gammaproteobacteria bacterium]|nr:DNA helicase UvrD [Gammaproteobacteria bacterium]
MRRQIRQFLIAIDQLVNVICGGWADETLSSRCYRCAVLKRQPDKRWLLMYTIVNCIFCSKTHCKGAYESEQKRSQLPPSMRLR